MSHIHTNIVESLSSILLSSTYLLLSNVAYDIIHYDNIGVSSASVVLITTIPSWHQWHHVAAVVLLGNGQNGVNHGHSSSIFWRTKASPDMRFSLGAQKKIGLSKYDITFSFVCLTFLQKIKNCEKTMILATLSLNTERQDFLLKNGPCHRSSFTMV